LLIEMIRQHLEDIKDVTRTPYKRVGTS